MACGDERADVIRPVASDSTTTPVFFAFKRVRVADWTRARLSLVMDGDTGNIRLDTAARYANYEDALPGATAVVMPTAVVTRTANGQSFGGDFKDLDTAYQLVEFGLQVSNESAGNPEMAIATLTIELQE